MRFLPLVWAMLWRRRVRTMTTFASIAIAFMLFGMLQAFNSVFHLDARLAGADNLLTTDRYGRLDRGLPYAFRSRIEALPGVRVVTPGVLFPMSYATFRADTGLAVATDETIFADARFVTTPEYLRAFRETRTGLIAGRQMAAKLGWKVGDHIQVTSNYVQRRDGGHAWEFDVIGIFDFNEELLGEVTALRSFVRYDYVNEARARRDVVDLYIVKMTSPALAPTLGKAIDALFQNSGNPTRTQTEAEQQRTQLSQVGDVGLIVTSILSAVFFTLLIVAGNTMMRAFRERIPELAVLKTLGFTDARVAALVAVESLLLCVAAGLAGLALAWAALKPLAAAVAAVLPFLRLEWPIVLGGAALAFALGLLAALVPAWHSARLSVMAALART
ncbi:MAG: ABC transporter permease [Gammaproteobacteria bacterium]